MSTRQYLWIANNPFTFREEPGLLIAKYDYTRSPTQHEGIEVKAFPTIYLFPRDNRDPPIKMDVSKMPPDFAGFLADVLMPGEDNAFKYEEDDESEDTDADL